MQMRYAGFCRVGRGGCCGHDTKASVANAWKASIVAEILFCEILEVDMCPIATGLDTTSPIQETRFGKQAMTTQRACTAGVQCTAERSQ